MISKKLLNEILGQEVFIGKFNHNTDFLGQTFKTTSKATINIVGNEVKYTIKIENKRYKECIINIYELAHKCKEWAYTKDYHLNSKLQDNFWFCYCENLIHNGYDYVSKYKLTEPEAIFEACEWILKQKETK